MTRLKDKVAVVTGASKGIGAAIAKRLAEEGAAVVVNYAGSKEAADRVVAEIAAKGGKAIAVQADVSVPSDVVRLFTATKKAFDKVDILVNNAGVYEFQPLEGLTEQHLHKMFDVNVFGLLRVSKEALKYFGADGGSIINISSIASWKTPADASVYSSTKGAVNAITHSLSKELGARKIRVNTISPGMVETEGVHAAGLAGSEFQKQEMARTPLGRIGQPDDIAPAVAFLASNDASWITGATLEISGGAF
jgi:3-oxoacyl-[acyl-carrier protein] reductase